MARDLKKEVKYVIEWLASEFKYLKRLHNVLEKIQSENVSRQEKDLKTAFKVARYVGKSERRADKPLKNILSVLNKIKDTDLHRELKQMDIAGQKLVREGSLYLGSLRKGLKNTQTTISIRENYPSRSLEQKTQTQVSKLEVEVEDMEKWVSALQVGLKQVSKWQEKHTNELPRRNFLKKLAYGLGIAALNPAKALAKLPLTDSEINEIKNLEELAFDSLYIIVDIDGAKGIIKNGHDLQKVLEASHSQLFRPFESFHLTEKPTKGSNPALTILDLVKLSDKHYILISVDKKKRIPLILKGSKLTIPPNLHSGVCMRKIKKKYGLTIRPNTRFVMLYSGTNKHKFVNPCGDSRWGGITKYIDIDQEIISSKSSRGKKDELGSVIRDFSVIRSQIKDLYGRMKKEHGY